MRRSGHVGNVPEAKVDHLGGAVGIHHYILELDVAVGDAVRVHEAQAREYLHEEFA